jgi:hypothetical protein
LAHFGNMLRRNGKVYTTPLTYEGWTAEKVYITPSPTRVELHNPQPMKRSILPP